MPVTKAGAVWALLAGVQHSPKIKRHTNTNNADLLNQQRLSERKKQKTVRDEIYNFQYRRHTMPTICLEYASIIHKQLISENLSFFA
ncbi:hypothetical protein BG55_05240 [Erwinia mallotivora]|uniref:Uncharacterized protein n=1 Tax=Erwinia mallotivora TaxID=69222 RepID=A0A014NRL1_9GAMM|nr:hypothetical protein [Erwinia mallotivora]EXU76490.1 hypothetical protein BG55_05240 [Erwinia mallotivora]